MPNRSRKKPAADFDQMARRIVDQVTGEPVPVKKSATRTAAIASKEKDPAAVALGRKGGIKGGKARAAKMTKEQRAESARKAAIARWSKSSEKGGT